MRSKRVVFLAAWFSAMCAGMEQSLRAEPAPEWATKIKEAQKLFSTRVVKWWMDHPPCANHGRSGSGVLGGQKQIGTGEFGGSVNDDVELTNGWETIYLAAHDKEIGQSLRWLFDCVWSDGKSWKHTRPYNLLVHGYRDTKWDRCPEHSAENVSYSTPHMMFVEHGNPRDIERLMDSSEHFWIWTKVNPAGYRHFRSYLIGPYAVYKVKEIPQDEIVPWDDPVQAWEIGECSRPMKVGNFLLWYNRNPKLEQVYREWYDAWLAKAKRTDGGGKPYGILPGGVTWATDALGGNTGDWRYADPPGTKAHSYDWEQDWPMEEIHCHFLTAYLLYEDEKYLLPNETAIEYILRMKTHPDIGGNWPDLVQGYRVLSGRTKYDEQIVASRFFGLQYDFLKYLATKDKAYLTLSADRCLAFAAKNVGRWTDSPRMTQNDKGKDMYNVLRTIGHFYTGGDGIVRSRYPGIVVSWENTGYEFAALVLEGQRNRTRCKAAMYNFEAERKTVGMRVWQIEKGRYRVDVGPDANRDDLMDRVSATWEVDIFERGQTLWIDLPPRGMHIVEVTQLNSDGVAWTDLTDLAAVTADVKLVPAAPEPGQTVTATVTVHNLSSVDAGDIVVSVFAGLPSARGERLDTKTIASLAAPRDLDAIFPDCKNKGWPKIALVTVTFPMPDGGEFHIHVDPENRIPEICERNNIVAYKDGGLASPAEIEGSGDATIYPQ